MVYPLGAALTSGHPPPGIRFMLRQHQTAFESQMEPRSFTFPRFRLCTSRFLKLLFPSLVNSDLSSRSWGKLKTFYSINIYLFLGTILSTVRIQQWMKQRLVEPGYCHTTVGNEKINQGAENIHIYHCILPPMPGKMANLLRKNSFIISR